MNLTLALFWQLLFSLTPKPVVYNDDHYFYIRMETTSPMVRYSLHRSFNAVQWDENWLPPIMGTGRGLIGYVRKDEFAQME